MILLWRHCWEGVVSPWRDGREGLISPWCHWKKEVIWCAALSSNVHSGWPFGQKFRFNANVFFENVQPSFGTHIEFFIEIRTRRQILRCVTIEMNAFRFQNGGILVVKFSVFGVPLAVNLTFFSVKSQ